MSKLSVIEQLLEHAWMIRVMYGNDLKYRPDRFTQIGSAIMALDPKDREALQTATAKDFNHRLDHVLIIVPDRYKSLAKQVEEHRQFMKSKKV
jgi:hypothetical protein